ELLECRAPRFRDLGVREDGHGARSYSAPGLATLHAMYTGAPSGVWLYSSITSGIDIRMHPCEAAVPSELSSSVPWMPAPLATPIHRALIGSCGPGGIVLP